MRDKPYGLLLLPLLIAGFCVPLVLGWVGPNGLYGFRTEASLASETAWYHANRAAGWAGIAGGLAGFAANAHLIRADVAPMRRTLLMAGSVLGVAAVIVLAGSAAS